MFHIDRKMGTNELSFRGSIRNKPAEPWQVTIHDPPMFFAEMLAERLRQQGITVVSIARPGDAETLPPVRPLHVVRTSLPMVLNRTNADSQNMFAEALFKRVGQQVTGTPGGWRNGAAAMRLALRQRLGTRSAALQISDGSGMSRDNLVTARMLVELLAGFHNDDDPEKARIFRESLAHAGNGDDGAYEGTGTFEKGKRFHNLAPGHEVYGKSGYINGVSTLSGYLVVPDDDGGTRTIAFSLLFNDFKPPVYVNQIKALQNRLIELIDESVSAPAKLGG
jgi:D-alanyl-D-alanine carboxypeptidase/D-alanyl-D-alanine-endopeptidase (penicillin-binding protein 4)